MRLRPVLTGFAAGTIALSTLSVASLSASTPAQAAADATPGYTLRHITVQVRIGPHNGQSCKIDADIYKPDNASRHHKVPAILTTNGFGGTKDDSNESAIGRGFVGQHYAVLAYSGLGFGHTGCKIRLDDPAYDGKAGKRMVSVLAGKKAFTYGNGKKAHLHYIAKERPGDPRVGMIGGSYGGQIQYAVAMQDKRVDAIIPIITWNDLSYSLAPNNTSAKHGVTYRTPGIAKKEWVDLFFAAGIESGVMGVNDDPARLEPPCPNYTDETCNAAVALNTQGYPDPSLLALARHASVSTYMKRIKAPTLLVQGQKDTLFNLQEATATFHALRAQGTPTRMVWQSWGHSDSTPAAGELDFGAKSLRDSYLGRRFVNWMNHYVRGEHKAPVGPRFSYFRDWVKYNHSKAKAGTAVDKAYAERSRFSQKPTASLYFTGNKGLTRFARKVKSGSATYTNGPEAGTSYSETSGVEGSTVNKPVSDDPGTFAAFTSRKLAHGVAMVGSPRLTLHLSAPAVAATQSAGPAGHLVLFAKVYDIAPDGTVTLQHRLISPVRVRNVNKTVHVRLPGVVEKFKKGHQIQVVIAASDMAYANNAATQPVTITTSRQKPSVIRLPLTGKLRF